MLKNCANGAFRPRGQVNFDTLATVFGPYFDRLKVAHSHHYGPEYWKAFMLQISELWHTLPHYSETQLASISDPSLVIMGDRDALGGIDQAHRLYRNLGAGELSIIANAGHDAVGKPLFWDAVMEFLERHSGTQG